MQNKSRYIFIALLLVAGTVRFCVATRLSSAVPASPQHIVSLAPSVTETLYALGLWEKVAGVTEFCIYPKEVVTKKRVGGFGSVNVEAVLRCRSDLAVLPSDLTDCADQIRRAGVPVSFINTRSLPEYLTTLRQLGQQIHREVAAAKIIRAVADAKAQAEKRAVNHPKPRVLFVVGHSDENSGTITGITAIGRDGFYNELIESAGGLNAYTGDLAFPVISEEGITRLNPDIIIDALPVGTDMAYIREKWETFRHVNAVLNRRIYLWNDPTDTIPGPRSVQTLKKLSLAFFPE